MTPHVVDDSVAPVVELRATGVTIHLQRAADAPAALPPLASVVVLSDGPYLVNTAGS
jgi:hypothetical protein